MRSYCEENKTEPVALCWVYDFIDFEDPGIERRAIFHSFYDMLNVLQLYDEYSKVDTTKDIREYLAHIFNTREIDLDPFERYRNSVKEEFIFTPGERFYFEISSKAFGIFFTEVVRFNNRKAFDIYFEKEFPNQLHSFSSPWRGGLPLNRVGLFEVRDYKHWMYKFAERAKRLDIESEDLKPRIFTHAEYIDHLFRED